MPSQASQETSLSILNSFLPPFAEVKKSMSIFVFRSRFTCSWRLLKPVFLKPEKVSKKSSSEKPSEKRS